MDYELNQKRVNFERDGFIIEKDLIDKERIENIHNEAKLIFSIQIERIGLNEPWTFYDGMKALYEHNFETFKNCGKQVQHLISLHDLSLNYCIIETAKKVCGLRFPNICTRPVLMFNSKELASNKAYHTTPLHQDIASMQGSKNSIVAWTPLIEMDDTHGFLKAIPGSHKEGLVSDDINDFGFGEVTDTDYTESNFVEVKLTMGDVILFDAHLIHKSGDVKHGRIRWSAHFRYNDLLEPTFIERGYPHPYIYKPVQLEK
jgi:ectoine hydroxylase-related dioxygenase (phytanoyl-CoA dioxygenase family)